MDAPWSLKKNVINELNTLLFTHDLVDKWRLKNPTLPGCTSSNPSMKIQCRLDYLFLSKNFERAIADVKIMPNIFSDHSALNVLIGTEANKHIAARVSGNLITRYWLTKPMLNS